MNFVYMGLRFGKLTLTSEPCKKDWIFLRIVVALYSFGGGCVLLY